MSDTTQDPKRNPTLEDAWQLYAQYDHYAEVQQKRTRRLRGWMLAAGASAAVVVILNGSVLSTPSSFLQFLILLLSLTVAALVSLSFLSDRGTDWRALRSAAEAAKREIYTFRSQVGVFGEDSSKQGRREARLARKLNAINKQLGKSASQPAGMRRYQTGQLPPRASLAKGDNGFSPLWANEYLTYRLENQLAWFKNKSAGLDNRLRGLRVAAVLFGGIGVLLAAAGLEIWVAVTTTLLIALTSLIDSNQLEARKASCSQITTDLETIRMWWRTLSGAQRNHQENVEKLVLLTEKALAAETQPWGQTIQDELEALGTPETVHAGDDDWEAILGRDQIEGQVDLTEDELADLDKLVTSELDPNVVEVFQKNQEPGTPKYVTRDLDPDVVEAYQNLTEPAAVNQDILDEFEREDEEPPSSRPRKRRFPSGKWYSTMRMWR